MTTPDPDEHARRLAAESIAVDDPTGWFERLYVQAEDGQAQVPWDRGGPHPRVVEWARDRQLAGAGLRAMVVGCGLGGDSEFVAGLGFDTVAFDVSAAAVRTVQRRFPDSAVRYVTADLLDPPAEWRGAFDLVVETFTVQSMPESLRSPATVHIGQMVRESGTLVVHAGVRNENGGPVEGPPWPLTRADIDAFAAGDLEPVSIDIVGDGVTSPRLWRAEFRRPGSEN